MALAFKNIPCRMLKVFQYFGKLSSCHLQVGMFESHYTNLTVGGKLEEKLWMDKTEQWGAIKEQPFGTWRGSENCFGSQMVMKRGDKVFQWHVFNEKRWWKKFRQPWVLKRWWNTFQQPLFGQSHGKKSPQKGLIPESLSHTLNSRHENLRILFFSSIAGLT
jgi:hypothetical protein